MKDVILSLFALIAIFTESFGGGGNGTNGGGGGLEQKFEAMASQLKELVIQRYIETSFFFDGVHPDDISRSLAKVRPVFLRGGSAEPNWDKNKYSWNGDTLSWKDESGQRLEVDALYISELNSIFVSENRWLILSKSEQFLLVRKEYWRSFGKVDAPEIDAYILSIVFQPKIPEVTPGSIRKDGFVSGAWRIQGRPRQVDAERACEMAKVQYKVFVATCVEEGGTFGGCNQPFEQPVGNHSASFSIGMDDFTTFFCYYTGCWCLKEGASAFLK